ncbi:MAG: hypothetical protein ACTSRI_16090 [Promethearchaeota archaeon]
MQIFEVITLNEFPYMSNKEIFYMNSAKELINENNSDKVFLLVEHDKKLVLTYNGIKSPFKIQIYGGILAEMLKKQLKLFYRVSSLNSYAKNSKFYKEIMNKAVGGGIAKQVQREAFFKPKLNKKYKKNIIIIKKNLSVTKVFENINKIPYPEKLERKFIIIGGTIYAEVEETDAFVKEEKKIMKTEKMGRLNSGFTFFDDRNYSTRLIVKERKIQGIELFIPEQDKFTPLELVIPIINEERFSKTGNIESIYEAFQFPAEEDSQELEKVKRDMLLKEIKKDGNDNTS